MTVSNIEEKVIVFELEEERELEKHLYPVLCEYCKTLHIDAKVLNANSAKRGDKNSNLWRYPDVVGFEDALFKYDEPTFRLMAMFQKNRNSLYSFEVKTNIDIATLRINFFQAVANSSWANYSYLVAENLDEKVVAELRELCEMYKIGFIRLNKAEPSHSEILINAPYKAINWNYVKRLAELSDEFLEYIESITECIENNSKPL